MYPIIFTFGKITLSFYGVFVATAFLVALTYLSNKTKKSKEKLLSQDELYSLFIYMIVFGVVGSRVLFVLSNPSDFILNPFDVLKLWKGGLTYYGGFVTVILFLFGYVRIKKIAALKLGDFFAPAVALGHAIGRIGCFFAGCCYGKATNVPWAVMFDDKNSQAVLGVRLHPTQLYEAFGNFLIFLFLHFYSKKNSKKGMITAAYFMSYAVLRFTVEFFRGDPDRGLQYFGLSISQNISVMLFVLGAFIVCKKK